MAASWSLLVAGDPRAIVLCIACTAWSSLSVVDSSGVGR
jgi:hypothetical protein